MKKKYILFILIFIAFCLLSFNTKCLAVDLDQILNYVVTVDPRTTDGSLDINYEITWLVLDSTTEGPLEWVTIGTPNSSFTNVTAKTNNIKSISKYNGSNVKIVFNKKYYAGDQITFKYSIHQPNMCKVSGSKCKYEFTPAWFTDARVDKLTLRWNADKVKSSNSTSKDGNYLVWTKTNMSKGAKLTANIEYDKSSFSSLSLANSNNSNNGFNLISIYIQIIIILVLFCILISRFGGGGYYGHRGFYGGPRYYGGCAHSSCACASSCASSCAHSSCACACAGSGRAGCSKKDFYGTNLTSKKLKNVMEKK